MALYAGEGLCDERCEIDDYVRGAKNISELAANKRAAGKEVEADRIKELADYQASIASEAIESASVTPCPGRDEELDNGIVNVGMSDLATLCPVVRRLINTMTIIGPEGA